MVLAQMISDNWTEIIPANRSQNGPVLLHFSTGKSWEKIAVTNESQGTYIYFFSI